MIIKIKNKILMIRIHRNKLHHLKKLRINRELTINQEKKKKKAIYSMNHNFLNSKTMIEIKLIKMKRNILFSKIIKS